jgi:hypothetical protein
LKVRTSESHPVLHRDLSVQLSQGGFARSFMLLSVQVLTELLQKWLILQTVSFKQRKEPLFRIIPVRNVALASEVST